MRKPRLWSVMVLVVLVAAAGGYYYFKAVYLPSQTQAEPTLQTARVRKGDLVILVSGVGELVPEAQVNATFSTGGMVTEVYADVGDVIEAGQLLARLEDTNPQQQLAQSQSALQELVSPAGLIQAQISALSAETAYEKALNDLQILISPAVWQAEQDLIQVQTSLTEVSNSNDETLAIAQDAVALAEANLAEAQVDYEKKYLPAIFTKSYKDPSTGVTLQGVFPPTAAEIALSRAKLAAAQLALDEARFYADFIAQGAPCDDAGVLTIDGALPLKLDQACQSIRNANLAVENTRLYAPISGVLTNSNLIVGQQAGPSAVATVASLDRLELRVYVEENDLPSLQIGQRVDVKMNAYPNQLLAGQVRAIEPVLQNVGGTLTAVAWVDMADAPGLVLYPGMTAEVDVVAGEAIGALLVPEQALRELTPGSYAVFVVQTDGELKLTPVKVGLRDFANAEILSGLQAGDIVSTGNVETK